VGSGGLKIVVVGGKTVITQSRHSVQIVLVGRLRSCEKWWYKDSGNGW
jgi:hypothetical protein